jgi:hypothetical protein
MVLIIELFTGFLVLTKILLKIYVVLFNLQLCKKDLFGAVAEEKEVNQITGKLHEARKTKSYDTFQILAQTVTEKCLSDLIVPLREVRIKIFVIDTF